jgi:hypothetical protein
MKRIIALALFALATIGAIPGARAQQHVVRVDVPFDFTVGETLLPAGVYDISASIPGTVLVQSLDKHLTARIVSMHGNYQTTGASKVVFTSYADRYILRRILCPADIFLNVDVPSFRKARKMETEQALLQPGERTIVALN